MLQRCGISAMIIWCLHAALITTHRHFPKMTAVHDKRLRVLSQHLAHGGSCQHGNSNSHSQLQLLVQPEVQRALKAGKAVVALESTIISHGLHILCFTVYLFTIINQLHAAACRHAIPTEC